MGVRSAVLLALVGAVALYLATREQWDWDKLAGRLLVGLMLLVFGIGGWFYLSSLPPTTPVAQFWGIALGASKDDVLFLKGEPAEIIEPDTWVYAPYRSRAYHVAFGDSDQVVRILVVSGPGFGSGAPLLGIRSGFGVQRLVDRLGEPSRVLNLSNGLRRAYLYRHLNAVFILEQSTVESYGIYDPDAGDPFGEVGIEAGGEPENAAGRAGGVADTRRVLPSGGRRR